MSATSSIFTSFQIGSEAGCTQFIPPNERPQIRGVFAQVIAGDVEFPELVENAVLTGSGEERLIAWHNTVLRDATASITGTLSSGEDITERRRDEENLRRSEAFLNSIIEQSPYSTWISDATGTLVKMNQACRDLLKISDSEVVNKYNVLQDNIVRQQGRMALVRSVFEEGETVHFQLKYDSARLETLDLRMPSVHLLEVNIFPIKDNSGRVTNAVIQHLDITERKMAEEELKTLNKELDRRVVERTAALRDSENRLRFIMSAGPGVLYTREAHGDFAATFISENVSDLMGYGAGKFLEDPGFWASKIHPDDAARVFADLSKVLETGSHEHEYRFLHANGSTVWMHDSHRLVKDEQDRPVELIGLWMDITAQKLAQENVERTNTELTATNKELEAFAYSVSHDLRAPLRGIDGFSNALLEDYHDKLDDTGKDYLKRVRAGTQRMGGLIDDLLKLSRMTRIDMRHQTLDLGAIARKIAAELRRGEPERRVDFEIAPGITAHGDSALMKAALDNLLRNSWKFTSLREQARIELGVTEQEGERVYFVRDDGAGFDMAYADKLFGAFQRLHTSDEFEGAGIGLATVERIIRRHGGDVWAEGEVGKGATFYFTLMEGTNE